MDRSRRIFTGGWLDTAISVFTRGWFGIPGVDAQGRMCLSAVSLIPQPDAVGLAPAPAATALISQPSAATVGCD